MSGLPARCMGVCRTNKCRIITSDVLQLGAAVLMIITLAITVNNPTSSLSWSKFSSDSVDYNLGLLQWQACSSGRCAEAKPASLFVGNDFDIPSKCVSTGTGMIVAATFAMLFGVLSVFFLHYFTTLQGRCCRLPFPRIFITIASFLALCLYIVVVATWYEKCQNPFNSGQYLVNGSTPSLSAGYAVATAIVCIVLAFLAWAWSFWRICFPNKNEPTPDAAPAYNPQASTSDLRVSSPSAAASATPYKAADPPAASSNGGSYGNGNTYGGDDDNSSGGGYGGSSGGYGGSSGGYGGSGGGGGGGAYSDSSYGGAYGGSNKQQSAYGY